MPDAFVETVICCQARCATILRRSYYFRRPRESGDPEAPQTAVLIQGPRFREDDKLSACGCRLVLSAAKPNNPTFPISTNVSAQLADVGLRYALPNLRAIRLAIAGYRRQYN